MECTQLVGDVINQLKPLIENEANLQYFKSPEEAKNLLSNLEYLHQLLENNHLTLPSNKLWLEKLQELAYEIEDTLDEFEIDKNKQVQETEEESPPAVFWDKVCPSLLTLCSRSGQFIEHRQISLEVQDLNNRVKGMYDEAENVLNLENVVGRSGENQESIEIEPSMEPVLGGSSENQEPVDIEPSMEPVIVEAKVHGRDSDKEALKRVLLSYGGESSQSVEAKYKPIIAIVGVGGLGKTTLAKLVYNDEDIKEEFPQRIWVFVSHRFDEVRVAREILEALDRPSSDVSVMETLMRRIKEEIGKKGKFLLVLDDMWTKDDEKWEPLKDYLSCGCEGSKILMTTRDRKIAESIKVSHIHELKELATEDAWLIIKQLALSDRSPSYEAILQDVGRDIAKKCDGLPIAAEFLGKLLHYKETKQDWELILGSVVWKMENVKEDIFKLFFISYQDLKPELKRCFSHCGLFPNDHHIDVAELIRMWIAQGFISSSANGGEMELQGREYFMELAQRGFFQDLKKGECFKNEVIECTMHDIVHDFAKYLIENTSVVDGVSTTSKSKDGVSTTSTSKDGVSTTSKDMSNSRHSWIENSRSTLISTSDGSKFRSLIRRNSNENACVVDGVSTTSKDMSNYRHSWLENSKSSLISTSGCSRFRSLICRNSVGIIDCWV